MYLYLGELYSQGKIDKDIYKKLINRNIIHSKYGKGTILNVIGELSKYIDIKFKSKRVYEISTILQYISVEIDDEFINKFKDSIKEIECENRYIKVSEYKLWKSKYKYLYEVIKYIRYDNGKKSKYIDKFEKIYMDNNADVANQKYLSTQRLKSESMFNNINGISLDEFQRDIIVKDEDRHLVIAGAGCGKTTLICGKVKYLLEEYNINPSEVAVISFSNKSVDDMNNKFRTIDKLRDIEVMTIHKLGKHIISDVEKRYINVCDTKDKFNIIKNCIEDLLEEDLEFKDLILTYYTKYYYARENKSFRSENEYLNYLKYSRTLITINGEIVRSFEELEIANFLFINGIKYKYEANYEFEEGYNPDFYLYEYKIYIEHFAEDENGNAPDFFDDREEYIYRNREKVEKHNRYGTNLIITKSYYKYQYKEGITEYLKDKLIKRGVRFKAVSEKTILNSINTNIKYKELNNLISRFIDYIKNENIQYSALIGYSRKSNNVYTTNREKIFFSILSKVYDKYQIQLNLDKKIDFSDMINKAKSYVVKDKTLTKYKYIIIDEMQDTSKSINEFIKCLLSINEGCKLFCVGDDWQSIYGFNGCDVNLFNRFKEIYINSYVSYMTNTYRFDDELVNTSNKFIMLDENNISKKLSSLKGQSREQCIEKYNLEKILDSISQIEGKNTSTVYLLGRYKNDKNIMKKYNGLEWKDNDRSYPIDVLYRKNTNLKIKFMTVHGSKGLEADYIVILNCQESTPRNFMRGFPSEIRDDPLLNIRFHDESEEDKYCILSRLKSVSRYNELRTGEERRLFYVAMTRAKKQTFLLLPRDARKKSKYLYEIDRIKLEI